MSVGTTIAIVAPNAVAAIAIVAAWKQHGKTLEAQRELADLADVRGLLDEAAVALHRAAYALDEVRRNFLRFAGGFFRTEDRSAPYRAVERAGQELDALLERLTVRLGRDRDVVRHFAGCDEAALLTFRTLNMLKLEFAVGDEPAAGERVKLLTETRESLGSARTKFDESRRDFMDAAQRLAGAKLGD